MKITEHFVQEILSQEFPQNDQIIYDESPLLQYLGSLSIVVEKNSGDF